MFGTYLNGEPERPDVLALWPIAHAVWRMDQQLDAQAAGNEAGSSATGTDLQGGQQRVHLISLVDEERDNVIEEQTTPEFSIISDTVSSITDLFFVDKDLDLEELGGVITWDEPAERVQVTHYLVYLASSSHGANRSQVGDAIPDQFDELGVDL